MFYPQGAQGFAPVMGWAQQPAVGGYGGGGGRPGYVSSRSEVGVPSALRSQEKVARQQQQQQ